MGLRIEKFNLDSRFEHFDIVTGAPNPKASCMFQDGSTFHGVCTCAHCIMVPGTVTTLMWAQFFQVVERFFPDIDCTCWIDVQNFKLQSLIIAFHFSGPSSWDLGNGAALRCMEVSVGTADLLLKRRGGDFPSLHSCSLFCGSRRRVRFHRDLESFIKFKMHQPRLHYFKRLRKLWAWVSHFLATLKITCILEVFLDFSSGCYSQSFFSALAYFKWYPLVFPFF